MKRSRQRDGKIFGRTEEIPASSRLPISASLNCPACGTAITREFAKFCRVCGKILSEDYQPLDTLRSSYRLQGKSLKTVAPIPAKTENLFEENKNSAAMFAWAFVAYSLVPYLGILFCPGALVMGGVGIFRANRVPYPGGSKISAYSIGLSFVIFAFQIFLWWLLYLIPEIGI